MSFPQGCSFRATAGFVTDGANDYRILGSTYPTTTTQGNVCGWEQTVQTRDRSSGVDPRVAGINFILNSAGSDANFRIDLPVAGSYNIRMAIGDATNEQNCSISLYDNTTLLTAIVSAGDTVSAGRFFDATGVLRSSASVWASSNAPITQTFSSTICRVRLVFHVASLVNAIAYFYIEAAASIGKPQNYYAQMRRQAF
jgi:hypothetical protein